MLTTDLPGDRPRRILIIDDSRLDRLWLRNRLAGPQIEIIEAADGHLGLDVALAESPDLILLDLGLPDADGFEVLRRLKDDRRTRDTPVIVVSATTATADKVRGLDAGAVDYVTKPYDLVELHARVRVALRTKRLQDLLEQRAHVDGLTGLANRLALDERLATEWAVHARHADPLAIWVADLDHFKRVNDLHGHAAGDAALRQAASILRATVRATDMAARFGGEEFVVVAPRCGLAGALKTAERFRDRLAETPIALDHGGPIRITVSVGVASIPEDLADAPESLLARADAALYEAKALGRNRVLASPNNRALSRA